MIEIGAGESRLPLQVANRVLMAPGVWAPDGRLPFTGLGAVVTPPLGWEWDGNAARWEPFAGGLRWTPPRRPLERFLRRLSRERDGLPRIVTLAPDAPHEIERAMVASEVEETTGFLLWEATAETIAAAKRAPLALPVVAEVPCNELGQVGTLVAAGADILWLGAPRVQGGRLWGPAMRPLMLAAVKDERVRAAGITLIAGAGIGSATDALRLHEAGTEAVALDPAWWVRPALADEVLNALQP